MSFERLFKTDMLVENFNKKRYVRSFKDRANISRVKLDTYSDVSYLNIGDKYTTRYENALSTRYASALRMSYDLLISVFNVNTRDSLICRTFRFDASAKSFIDKHLESMEKKRPNIEVRLIGMQSGQEYSYLYEIAELISSKKLPLVEVDLFGGELRHIAMDTKLGMSFNVLLDNRLYRAGELKNTMTTEQFERGPAQNTGAP